MAGDDAMAGDFFCGGASIGIALGGGVAAVLAGVNTGGAAFGFGGAAFGFGAFGTQSL